MRDEINQFIMRGAELTAALFNSETFQQNSRFA
jgi:hypothetical protein